LTFDPDSWAPPGSDRDPWRATKAHTAWCAARASWSSTRLWPTGEGQREIEEAIVTPDEPFDADHILVLDGRSVSGELAELRAARRT
jgi:hypothetical protein